MNVIYFIAIFHNGIRRIRIGSVGVGVGVKRI